MSSVSTSFFLPDLLALFPSQGCTNPHYTKASEESYNWLMNFSIFRDHVQKSLHRGESELLCSYAYHYAEYEILRTCCDVVNLLFVLDEVSDKQNGQDALQTGNISCNAMCDPDYEDGSELCAITKQVRARLLRDLQPASFRRFTKHYRDYLTAVAKEAELREHGLVLDLESYQMLRRNNSAVWICFDLFGTDPLGNELTDGIYNHPIISSMFLACVDMVCWSNDLYSYNMEQAMGHIGNNILTVLMKEKSIGLQEAADYTGRHFKNLLDQFLNCKANLPSFGPKWDPVVAHSIMAMEAWVVGNLEWSFDVQRYFGRQHSQIKQTLIVDLYPKRG